MARYSVCFALQWNSYDMLETATVIDVKRKFKVTTCGKVGLQIQGSWV